MSDGLLIPGLSAQFAESRVEEHPLTLRIDTDRIMKLREMFNKAGEGKVKLSVNDFSE